MLKHKSIGKKIEQKLSDEMNVNHKILANKDGNYAWRPLQIIHPLVYVDLVNYITQKKTWNCLLETFKEFQGDSRIKCISIPVQSKSSKKDNAESILNWWENLEQSQIEKSLDFDYCIHTDVTDCYSSIYTHTISWAIHSKEWAKKNKQCSEAIGNKIDKKIRNLQNGQTNGIPQGSILMDFFAEIILGYADKKLSEEINQHEEIVDFQILRYRDDYRIFSTTKEQTEIIVRLLSDILSDLNLKLSPNKTFLSQDLILDAIKPDKIYWNVRYSSFSKKTDDITEFYLGLQKHLLEIKILGDKYKNCGSLKKALSDFYKYRIIPLKCRPGDVAQLISIDVDIMYRNPKTIEIGIAILGGLFNYLGTDEIQMYIERIEKKFMSTPNTGIVEIWLQRLSILNNRSKEYNSELCKKVSNDDCHDIWNSNWFEDGFSEEGIIDENEIEKLSLWTPLEDVDVFNSNY